jgi:hypothetical protein
MLCCSKGEYRQMSQCVTVCHSVLSIDQQQCEKLQQRKQTELTASQDGAY